MFEAILRGIFRHDSDSDDDGDVVLRLGRKDAAPVELPEIGIAGALDGALHRTGTGVIRGQRKVPIAKLLVEIFEMFRGGARGFFGILALVDEPIFVKSVS